MNPLNSEKPGCKTHKHWMNERGVGCEDRNAEIFYVHRFLLGMLHNLRVKLQIKVHHVSNTL